MALGGIDNGGAGLNLPPHLRTPGAAGERRVPQSSQTPVTHAPAPVTQATESDGTLPVTAPAGTDPALWSVLTSEERVFFARIRSLGPLTYGPGTKPDAQAIPRGGRLDVRV